MQGFSLSRDARYEKVLISEVGQGSPRVLNTAGVKGGRKELEEPPKEKLKAPPLVARFIWPPSIDVPNHLTVPNAPETVPETH